MVGTLRIGRIAAGLAILCLAVSCIRIGGKQERRLVELNDGPIALRLKVAKEYACDAQLASLRARAKREFPQLMDSDLATLGLGWQQWSLADGEHVMIVVTFMPNSKSVDAAAVADAMARTVLEDVRPKFGRQVQRPTT